MLHRVQSWIERRNIIVYLFVFQVVFLMAGCTGVFLRWPLLYVPCLIAMVAICILVFALIMLRANTYK